MDDILKIDRETDTEDLYKKNNSPTSDFDTIVLSGGSSKGIMILGALQYAYDNFLMNKINKYIGTSVGSIICFLLLIGYTPIEIMVYLCTHEILEKLQHFNIVAMINGNGALSYSSIYEQLEKMTIDKIGYLPTFKDIKEKYEKELICVTYNLTDNKTEYLSYENNPNLPCLIGIKMSSNLPLIFEKFKYNNNFYIDGGISDDFAIDIGDKMGNKILGIVITIDNNSFSSDGETILEYIYKLIFIPIAQSMESKINNVSSNCKIIKLSYNKLKFFNFNVNSKEKLDIFSIGYESMKEQIE
jgi:predicted patatin/cPLA2 family phospholipase